MREPKITQVLLEFETLRQRLDEAEQTLEAIRQGEVDALVVYGDRGEQVFTLKGAEQPYRVFLEQMQEGAATLADDGSLLYANPRLAEMLQAPLTGVMGQPFEPYIAEPDREMFADLLERARRGTSKAELTLQAGDVTLPVLVSITSLEEQEARFAITFTDLTEPKRNEKLLASERLAHSILENATEAIVVCDAEGRIVRANGAAQRLAGTIATLEPFYRALPVRLSGSTVTAELPRPLAAAFQGATVRGLSAELTAPDGRIVDLLIGAGPLAEGSGLVGCVITLTDITDRNAAFREVHELNETLEARVEDRTEQLVAANRELEGFTYSVSHDLRAPLRSMMSASMIMLEDYAPDLPEGAAKELTRMANAAKRMASLIDDLLRFSRLGRQEMTLQTVDLSDLAHSVILDLGTHLPTTHIDFQVQPGLQAKGDPLLLRLVLDNLFGNAVKFSRENRSPVISFGMLEGETPTTFFVRDNGIGFDQRYVDKIFQPFERLHSDKEYAGTGIGLANVQRIVTRHGGRVWAEGRPREGATFFFTLEGV